jgi:multiple sugar transport system ATP-binding protein
MDEPLSNLDAKLRVQMRAEIARLQRELGVTTIYVTHDQVEAMTMGDRVAVMRKGELQQVDEPQTLYDQPRNLFVAGFIGSPAMNMVRGTLERENGSLSVSVGTQRLPVDDQTVHARPGLARFEGREVVLGIRPEDFEDASLRAEAPARLRGTVELREALGAELVVHVKVEGARAAVTEETRELAWDRSAGENDAPDSSAEGDARLVARLDAHAQVREGDALELAVDTRTLHFFDPETGLGIYDEETKGVVG